MTAKQQLLERVQRLSEDEAEQLLCQLPAEEARANRDPTLFDELRAIFDALPAEVLRELPKSDDIDHVLYGTPRSK